MFKPFAAALSLIVVLSCAPDNHPLDSISSPVTSAGPSSSNATNGNSSGDPTNGNSSGDPTTGNPTSGDPTGGSSTGSDPTGGSSTGSDPPTTMRVCELYLDCLAIVSPAMLPMAQEGFGPDGTCWQGSPDTAEQCIKACETALNDLHEVYPDEPACGLCQENTDCPNGLCKAGECQPPGCGDGVVADDEICDGPGCAVDCQGPEPCNPLSLYGCSGTDICAWYYGPECIPYDPDLPGDGNFCDEINIYCEPGHICSPASYIPGCPAEGCCTRLCNITIADDCPNGRHCVALTDTNFSIPESLSNYVGLCLPD